MLSPFCRGRRPAVRALTSAFEALERRQLLSATPWSGFAHDAQHTADSSFPAQPLDTIHWQTPVDTTPNGPNHYGSPVITQANTVIIPVRVDSPNQFELDARSGKD